MSKSLIDELKERDEQHDGGCSMINKPPLVNVTIRYC